MTYPPQQPPGAYPQGAGAAPFGPEGVVRTQAVAEADLPTRMAGIGWRFAFSSPVAYGFSVLVGVCLAIGVIFGARRRSTTTGSRPVLVDDWLGAGIKGFLVGFALAFLALLLIGIGKWFSTRFYWRQMAPPGTRIGAEFTLDWIVCRMDTDIRILVANIRRAKIIDGNLALNAGRGVIVIPRELVPPGLGEQYLRAARRNPRP